MSYILKKLRLAVSIVFALALTLTLSGCAKTPESLDSWGVYLYLCGSNLETKMGAAGKNIGEILAADIPDGVSVVIETGGAQKWRYGGVPDGVLCRYTVKDGKLCEEQRLENASMGDSGTLPTLSDIALKNTPLARFYGVKLRRF